MSQSIHENFFVIRVQSSFITTNLFLVFNFLEKAQTLSCVFSRMRKKFSRKQFSTFYAYYVCYDISDRFSILYLQSQENNIKPDRIIEIISIFHFNSLISYYPFMKMSIKKNGFELSGIKSKYIHEENEKIQLIHYFSLPLYTRQFR